MNERQRSHRRAARARALSVRQGSKEPPAWATTKWGDEPSWRRAALKLSQDILKLTREEPSS